MHSEVNGRVTAGRGGMFGDTEESERKRSEKQKGTGGVCLVFSLLSPELSALGYLPLENSSFSFGIYSKAERLLHRAVGDCLCDAVPSWLLLSI